MKHTHAPGSMNRLAINRDYTHSPDGVSVRESPYRLRSAAVHADFLGGTLNSITLPRSCGVILASFLKLLGL